MSIEVYLVLRQVPIIVDVGVRNKIIPILMTHLLECIVQLWYFLPQVYPRHHARYGHLLHSPVQQFATEIIYIIDDSFNIDIICDVFAAAVYDRGLGESVFKFHFCMVDNLFRPSTRVAAYLTVFS